MRRYKIIIALADLHFGVRHISAETMREQLSKHFFAIVSKMNPIDMFAICGDIFHTTLSLNSDYSELFHWFIDRLYKLAREKGAAIVIVKGTMSHDMDQLDNIRHMCDNGDGVDFRIYDTVTEDTIWEDYKFLALPDVRVKKLKEVGKYLSTPGKYDFILGHGLVSQMRFTNQESENQPTQTYVYDTGDLTVASKGPVLFGHIHQHLKFGSFYYVGPFTVLERGGNIGGFVVAGIYDDNRRLFKVEHHDNPDSAEYIELKITPSMIRDWPIDEVMSAIDDVAKSAKSNDLITLKINRGDEAESADKVLMLEARYRGDPRFSIKKNIKTKAQEEEDDELRERREKYGYLTSEADDVPTIMYRYYLSDFKPKLPDQTGREARLTLEDFERVLGGT